MSPRVRKRRWLSVAAALSMFVAVPVLGAPSAAQAEDGDDDHVGDPALIRLKIKRGDKTIKHPGMMGETGREFVIVFKDGNKKHEVTILFEKAGSSKNFKVKLALASNGKRVLAGKHTAKAKKWVTFKSKNGKTKVLVLIDPDSNRPDSFKKQKNDDPLGDIE